MSTSIGKLAYGANIMCSMRTHLKVVKHRDLITAETRYYGLLNLIRTLCQRELIGIEMLRHVKLLDIPSHQLRVKNCIRTDLSDYRLIQPVIK